ncbi:MAG: methyltransferase domain-containing protein [bacterium]|nr:methyltransferase domain-containing protein [bacterium]
MTLADYNLKYLQKGLYWGLKPHSLVVDSVKFLPLNAKILDLGCGEGRNSLFLAGKGFDLTAIDIAEEGIKKLKKFAKKENLNINAYVSDVKSYLKNCQEFDAIFGINVLQFIDQNNIFSVIKKTQSKTKPNGLNVVASFIATSQKAKKAPAAKGRYLFGKGELKKLYKDFQILFYEEKMGDWETHKQPRHRHFVVRLIAKKAT